MKQKYIRKFFVVSEDIDKEPGLHCSFRDDDNIEQYTVGSDFCKEICPYCLKYKVMKTETYFNGMKNKPCASAYIDCNRFQKYHFSNKIRRIWYIISRYLQHIYNVD